MSNKLRLCYQEFGDKNKPAVLLVMGLGTQMIAWTEDFCEELAGHGYRVIRFDNRDIGLSEKIRVRKPVSIPSILIRAKFGLPFKVPYTLNDMAKDTIGVMDALDIESAHVVGASMGGMISQIVAADFPERCLSLTSIMSTTGNRNLPGADWRVTKQLLNRPSSMDESQLLAHGLQTWEIIGSPDYPPSKEEIETKVLRSIRRSYYPPGYRNQMAAIIHNGDRTKLLSKIKAPTLVIHGKADVLVPVTGGIDTAKHIPGSELVLLDGMGHDLPKELRPKIINLIAQHAKKS
jgi:pimeloyl-ACP methyl ester carboxylesterase